MVHYLKPLFLLTAVGLCVASSVPDCFAGKPASHPTHNAEYLREMPSVERVLADIQGKNPTDRVQRQIAALARLGEFIKKMRAGGEYGMVPMTEEETALFNSYSEAVRPLIAKGGFDLKEQNRLIVYWQDQHLEGFRDKSIEKELFQRYFSPAWQARYHSVMAQEEASHRDYKRAQARARGEWTDEDWGRFGKVLLGVLGYLGVLIVVTWFNVRGTFKLDRSDPYKLIAGRARYQLHSATGTVLSPTKEREVQTVVSGGGSTTEGISSPVSSSSTTIIHVQFFLKEANGTERSIQLADVDLALRDGQKLSVVWGIKEGEKRGPYFVFYNHSTQRVNFDNGVFKELIKIRQWPLILLTAPFFCIPGIPFFFIIDRVRSNRMGRLKQQIVEYLIPQLAAAGKTI